MAKHLELGLDTFGDVTRAPDGTPLSAARVIRDDTGARPCVAVARIVPQLMWYAGCQVFASALLDAPLPADRTRYAVTFTRWPIDLAPILAALHLRATPLPAADPRAQVWRLE